MATITIPSGIVATTPRHIMTTDVTLTSFRLAVPREDGESDWYTVTASGNLAKHAATSVHKGDRVVVVGDPRVREWTTGEKSGSHIEIVAASIGHDLNYGRTQFTRVVIATSPDDDQED